MVLASNLCLFWIVVNLFVMLPKKITRDETLFLFLTSSLLIMFALINPAKRLYIGDPGLHYSAEQGIAFLVNRNLIFPFLTIIAVNLMQYGIQWQKGVTVLISFLTFILYSYIEERYTVVSHVSLPSRISFFFLYFALILLLLKGFRLLAETEPLR
ncbi:hypothetical protein [Sporolactobacillus putidus]|uniref:Uncharacterized protein n=1 Tax=Sporolactobacillus putidus TaxID=492735 RepID=A0A917S0F1_9BACL|nr:hypothetical protein [Sporolactobacillus putidus]GGL48368.1 hypothetical protein GCM10007968_10730 [Sporolactobacillus putidus]